MIARPSITVQYDSLAQKQVEYPRKTIPAIFDQALAMFNERRNWAKGPAHAGAPGFSAKSIHDWARAQIYEREEGPQDEVKYLGGAGDAGDCEDWAAVLLCEYWRTGKAARLVTAGDLSDNFRHVYVEVKDGGRWVASDPKGSQAGLAFEEAPELSVKRYWRLDGSRVVEVPQGSGLDPLDLQAANYLRVVRQLGTSSMWEAVDLQGKTQVISRQLADRVKARLAAGVAPGTTQQQLPANLAKAYGVSVVAPPPPPFDDDKFLAAWLAAQIPYAQVVAVSDAMGATGDEEVRRGAIADALVLQVRLLGQSLRNLLKAGRFKAPMRDDADLPVQGVVAQGSKGIDFRVLGEKFEGAFEKAGSVLRAVQTGIGVGLQQLGRAVLKLGEKAPWINQYFSKPLGFHLLSTAVAELGDALVDGTIKSFDLKKTTYAVGNWFSAVGQALATAAPFTGPWAPLFAACGAINSFIGNSIKGLVQQSQRPSFVRSTVAVDAQGRVIGRDGLPTDSIERAVELQRRTAQGAQQDASQYTVKKLNWGGDWGVLPTAIDREGIARAVYVNGAWAPLKGS